MVKLHLFNTLFAVLFGLMLPATSNAQDAANDVVEVVFKSTTSEGELQVIQDRMKARGIELVYMDLKYDQGRLAMIDFKVKTDKGEGSARADIKDEQKFGFRYDPTPGAEIPFVVGSLF